MSYIFQPFRYELREAVKIHSGSISGKVLDVGAGSSDRYSSLFKFDSYTRMDREGVPNVDAHGRVEDIPFPDGMFDSIVCTQVMGDIFDLRAAFAEIARVLKRGGSLLLTESFIDPPHDEPFDFWRFTPHSLRKLCENAGLEVDTIEPIGGFWSAALQSYERLLIKKMRLYDKWYGPLFGNIFRALYVLLPKKNKLLCNGFIVIARKPL